MLGGRILRDAGVNFDESKDYDWIKTNDLSFNLYPKTFKRSRDSRPLFRHVGYAGYYLEKSKETNAALYRQLVDIDTGLGTKASDQLLICLFFRIQPEIIEVRTLFFSN